MIAVVYFSPTHTTQTLVRQVAKTITDHYEEWDLTYGQKAPFPTLGKDDLCIVGAPVYSGRIPPLEKEYLKGLTGKETPCLLLTVYGNRAYEDALLELSDLLTDQGFCPIGAGAFIGEHSLIREVGEGRPDQADLQAAAQFALEAMQKGKKREVPLALPGNRPYKPWHASEPWTPHPTESCVACGTCVRVCPVGIISPSSPFIVNKMEACLHCCACVKSCPVGARVADAQPAQEIIRFLQDTCQERKDPEWFV